ncbi:IQ and ubiquitin-like domain-containing protein [Caerostris darwini]|uniref:IQ and ubiquitin-like domain-containing protein n=1 Tax=Caerostris darwini TaxID=1538125 RepID=A0AAV4QPN1_9ARAC|nr:IQ and ubiquitin-like domain-containing protein [Caerostris darwini]
MSKDDAQTVESRDKAQQTSKDASTQVEARNLYIRTGGDKTLAATDNYVYADDIKKEYLNKITRLQAYIRNWLAFKELLRRKQRALEENEWEKKQAVAGQFKDTDWLKDMEKRRLHPKSEDDFKLIFSDLQKWWNSESKSISEVRSGADCKAAMWMLLNEEASKIEEVNKKKNKFENENFSQNREKVLKRAAKSKVWRAYEDTVEVQTSTTLRARYLHDLYQTLSMKYLSAQDRVDVLTNLKKVLKPYHSKMTDNLVQLANREIDLHLRGIKNTHLGGLQNRICNLFWQFVKKPTFNPEMQSLKKMKTDTDSTPYIMCCTACKCFYILPINSTEDVLGKSPSDVGHLVDKIWKHQSCIGGSREDMELELTRFDIKKNWTPWNCLLVTRQEAATLSRIPDSETKFDKKFKKCVTQKHVEARRYFSSIPRFLPYLANSQSITDYDMSSEDEKD